MAYAKEEALELGLVDMEPGQDSERFDVLGYLIIYWWLAMRTSTSLDRANDSVGDMMMMCNLESKVSRLL